MALSIFSSKKDKVEALPIVNAETSEESKQAFNTFGKLRAEEMGGSPQIIHPMLHEVYMRIKQQVEKDEQKQAERKSELQSKIDLLQSDLNNLEQKKTDKQKELDFEEKKIEEKKNEISSIRQDPSRVLKQPGSPKTALFIGLFILIFLSIYLFVFYSSAAYSALFKEFVPSKTGIADKIFDPQAIPHAMQAGILEVVLILTIPFVFLGLGYLIHRISTGITTNNIGKIIKTGALILVTFAFDTILAYGITMKIYNLNKNNSFNSANIPDFNLHIAFRDNDFWIIIFAGFVAYIIWGLVFKEVMSEANKLNRVQVAINESEKKIVEYKVRCKELKADISRVEQDINTTTAKIKEMNNTLASTIVLKSDIRLGINEAVNGWIAYMNFHNFSDTDKKLVIETKDAFLASIASQFETI